MDAISTEFSQPLPRVVVGQEHGAAFTLEARLVKAGFSVVYRAADPVGNRLALKEIIKQYPGYNPDLEAEIHRMLSGEPPSQDPSILPFVSYDRARDSGLPFLVTPFMEEGTLRDRRLFQPNKRLLLDEAITSAVDAACALANMHTKEIRHGDVKEANFFRRTDPLTGRVAVLAADFGTAMRLSESLDNGILGTPNYMAPELIRGENNPASDVYALAIMTYLLATGKYPIDIEDGIKDEKALYAAHLNKPTPLRHILQEMNGRHKRVEAVIHAGMNKDPDKRPTAAEYAALLREANEDPKRWGRLFSGERKEQTRKQSTEKPVGAPLVVDPESALTQVRSNIETMTIEVPATVKLSREGRVVAVGGENRPGANLPKKTRKKAAGLMKRLVAGATATVLTTLGFTALDGGFFRSSDQDDSYSAGGNNPIVQPYDGSGLKTITQPPLTDAKKSGGHSAQERKSLPLQLSSQEDTSIGEQAPKKQQFTSKAASDTSAEAVVLPPKPEAPEEETLAPESIEASPRGETPVASVPEEESAPPKEEVPSESAPEEEPVNQTQITTSSELTATTEQPQVTDTTGVNVNDGSWTTVASGDQTTP